MAKNKSFENVYQVTISGRCTNGFMAKVMHKVFTNLIEGLGYGYAQTNVSYKVLKTEGDFDVITGETNE